MLRTLAIMGIFASCFLFGMQASNRLRLRWHTLRALLQSFHQLALRMEYAMQPLGALALHCGNARTAIFFTAFSEKLEEQPDVLSAWICAMEHAQAQDAGFASLESEELTAMQEYAAALGESGYSAQEKNALLLEKRLEEIAKRAAEVYRQKGRMYRSMGILSGMAAAILLL